MNNSPTQIQNIKPITSLSPSFNRPSKMTNTPSSTPSSMSSIPPVSTPIKRIGVCQPNTFWDIHHAKCRPLSLSK